MNVRRLVQLFMLLVPSGAALADESGSIVGDSADPFKNTWSDNLRWTIDSSTQQWLNSETDKWLDQYVVGLDLHKVVSTSERDIGTLILQPYVVWLPGTRSRPGFFDGNEATLTWRIANFNYIVMPRGRLNLRVGHFEIPFGLEQDINTNGTLRQYSNGRDLGIKADWGIGINGQLPKWQYEVGLTRGSGQEFHHAGDPYAFTARLGTPFERNPTVGLSIFKGRVKAHTGLIERKRIGADLRWMRGPIQFLAEISAGKDFDGDTRNWLAELNWSSRQEALLLYVQARRLTVTDAVSDQRENTTGLGARFLVGNRLTLALQLSQSIHSGLVRRNDNELRLHFRFRI